MATAVIANAPRHHFFETLEGFENSLRMRRVRLGLNRTKLTIDLDLPWQKIAWIDRAEEPDSDLSMGEILLIARTIYAVPRVICDQQVAWDESTPYRKIQEAEGWVELLFVQPLELQDMD